MAKYEIEFECVVTVEAKNKAEAIRKAWLTDNQNYNGVYKYIGIKKVPSTTKASRSEEREK